MSKVSIFYRGLELNCADCNNNCHAKNYSEQESRKNIFMTLSNYGGMMPFHCEKNKIIVFMKVHEMSLNSDKIVFRKYSDNKKPQLIWKQNLSAKRKIIKNLLEENIVIK